MIWNTLLIFVSILCFDTGFAKSICPGFCIPEDMCKSQNGKVLGFCTTGKACCDVPHNFSNHSDCGKVLKGGDNVTETFTSPNYPHYLHGSLICPYEIQLPEKVVALRLDLIRFELDGILGEKSSGRAGGNCDADMFFIKGFSDWMTDARCGHLSGYSVIMDLDLSENPENKVVLLFIMSSKSYRWKMRIIPITAHQLRKSELCLQTRMETWAKSLHYPHQLPQPPHTLNSTVSHSNETQHQSPPQFRAPWEAWIFTGDLTEGCNSVPTTRGSYKRRPCKATIVDDRHLLTTFSCLLQFQHVPLADFKIVRGSPCDSNISFMYTVEKIFIHFNYLSRLKSNDMAMIRTTKTLLFNKLSQPIPMILSPSPTNPPLKYQLYTQTTPGVASSLGHLSLVTTGHSRDVCQFALACQLQLSEDAYSALESSSNKYKELSQRSVCLLPESFSLMSNDTLEKRLASVFSSLPLGTPLLSAGSDGKHIILHGIFNYFQAHMPPPSTPEITYLHKNNTSLPKQIRSNGKKVFDTITPIVSFTNLSFYKRWLLIAVS